MAMKQLWLISAVLLAVVVETTVTNPVRERARRAIRNSCRNRPGCYSVIWNTKLVDQVDQVELSPIHDLDDFPTLAPALQNPSLEEFKKDLTYLQELPSSFKLDLPAIVNTPEDDEDREMI